MVAALRDRRSSLTETRDEKTNGSDELENTRDAKASGTVGSADNENDAKQTLEERCQSSEDDRVDDSAGETGIPLPGGGEDAKRAAVDDVDFDYESESCSGSSFELVGDDNLTFHTEDALTDAMYQPTTAAFHVVAGHISIDVSEESANGGGDDGNENASSDEEDSAFEDGDRSNRVTGHSALTKIMRPTRDDEQDVVAVTRKAEHVLALSERSDDNHVSIRIQDSPKPPITDEKNTAIVFNSLPPIEEKSISTVGVRASVSRHNRNALKAVGGALLEVLKFLPLTKMNDACLEKLNSQSATEKALDVSMLEELRALGEILGGKPVPRLSPQCYEAIKEMEFWGQILDMNFIVELRDSRALEVCANPPEEYTNYGAPDMQPDEIQMYKERKLAELRAAVASCTLSSLDEVSTPELLALWSLVHNSVSSRISAKMAEQVAAEDKQPALQKTRSTVRSLRFMGGEVVAEQHDEGDDDDDDIIDTSNVGELAKIIVKNGLVGLKKGNFAKSRQEVDAMLQSIRDQRQLFGWCWVAWIASFIPPLLRIEIIRDFVQITGLFFEGLYDPVLDFFSNYHFPVGFWSRSNG